MLKLENVATPYTAATVVVPASVALPGLAPKAMLTLPAHAVATLQLMSLGETTTAGAIATPGSVLVGWTVKSSPLAAPAVMLNAPLVALVTPLAEATSV